MVGGSSNCVGSFKVAYTATMPILRNLGFWHFHYNCVFTLAPWRNEALTGIISRYDVRKCLMSPQKGRGNIYPSRIGTWTLHNKLHSWGNVSKSSSQMSLNFFMDIEGSCSCTEYTIDPRQYSLGPVLL